MTGYTVHTGSTKKFTDGWDRIFSGKKKANRKSTAKKPTAKKTAKRKKKS